MTHGFQRQPPQPSPRNFAIFEEVIGLGRTQQEVAQRLGVSQSRVSQICRQVQRWFNQLLAAPGNDEERRQRFHTQRCLLRRRREFLYAEAIDGLIRELESRGTTRTGKVLNPGWIRAAMSISERLHQMDKEDRRLGVNTTTSLVEELDATLEQLTASIRGQLDGRLAAATAGLPGDASTFEKSSYERSLEVPDEPIAIGASECQATSCDAWPTGNDPPG